LEGGGGEKLLLFHPSFFHLEIPAGLLEHVGERGVFFHLPISDDVWLFFFFSPLYELYDGGCRVERTRSNGRCIFFFPPGKISSTEYSKKRLGKTENNAKIKTRMKNSPVG
jgi:hypothetical protein